MNMSGLPLKAEYSLAAASAKAVKAAAGLRLAALYNGLRSGFRR
jgi:hypothetical protein